MSNTDTEIVEGEIVEETQPAPPPPERKVPIPTGGSIAPIIPRDISEVYRVAQYIHAGGLATRGADTVEKVVIILMKGLELGLPPLTAMQGIAVINNRAVVWGDLLIGLINRSGLVVYLREWIEGEGDGRIAYCETQRRGREPVRRSFSVGDAIKAGLWDTRTEVRRRSGDMAPNDSPWFRYPQRMLQMRARAWCVRDVYADVLGGLVPIEEVEDYGDNPEPAAPARTVETATGVAGRLRAAGPSVAAGLDVDQTRAALTHQPQETVAVRAQPVAAAAVAARIDPAADAPVGEKPALKPKADEPNFSGSLDLPPPKSVEILNQGFDDPRYAGMSPKAQGFLMNAKAQFAKADTHAALMALLDGYEGEARSMGADVLVTLQEMALDEEARFDKKPAKKSSARSKL